MADAEITELLHEWRAGKPAALDRLFEEVYPRLRDIAGALFRNESIENVLQPTSVVNELFLKLVRQRSLRFEDREHFYSLSARIMRRVLIDHARNHRRQKRDGGQRVPLDENLAWVDASDARLVDLNDALVNLEKVDPAKCRIVELRFFLGFTATETAELLSTSKSSVDRDLRFVRGWLYDQLHDSSRWGKAQEMSDDRVTWLKLQTLFELVDRTPAEDRQRVLTSACDDPAIQARVLRMVEGAN